MSEFKIGDRARIARWGASGFNHCFDETSGTEGHIFEISPNGATVLKTEKGVRYGDISGLDPISDEPAKDPFAPGEYVTCLRSQMFCPAGAVTKVSNKHHPDADWFVYETNDESTGQGGKKSEFRSATPEEIAAYKAKYEAEDLIGISKEDADTKFPETFSKPKTYTLTPYIKPETVTIKGVEYIMMENV